jgi:hypothetical protein
MTQIESFANSGGPLEPLEMASLGGPVVLCTPAFAGAFVGLTANYAFDKAVDWYVAHHNGGHFAADGERPSWTGGASSDELLELLVARF